MVSRSDHHAGDATQRIGTGKDFKLYPGGGRSIRRVNTRRDVVS